MTSIGSRLFESNSEVAVSDAAIAAVNTGPKPARTFKFESASTEQDGDAKSKLKLAGFALVVVACVAVVMWISVREKNGETQKPILAKLETKSNLQIPSGGTVITEAPTPSTGASAPVAEPTIETASVQVAQTPSDTEVPKGATDNQSPLNPLPSETKGEAELIEPAPAARKAPTKPKQRVARASQTETAKPALVPLLVKTIDEREVVVEFEGTEYVVKRGQKLPDGQSVYVGYDRAESVMRTTAGDFRIGRM